MSDYILALDQGTTSSRAILFRHDGSAAGVSQQEFPQILPMPGHVEHDPEDIWSSQLTVAQDVLAQAGVSSEQVAAIGVTNQRETTLVWDRHTGKPVANAIVWQSRVSNPICEQLAAEGAESLIRERTGLLIDPYFSGTKLKHMLDEQDGLRERAERGDVLFGTVDSFLLWRLTGKHVTDVSNASRTLLFNIHTLQWDDELLALLDIPRAMLPDVVDSSGVVAETSAEWFGRPIPVSGIAGDQQAATFGQACFAPGDAKNTYGTGCFMLLNTGDKPVASQNRLLTTVGWRINGETTYCLEGSVFVAGAVVQWLRDGLGLIQRSEDVESLAAAVDDSDGVVLVPAFVGLGAPHWDARARGSMFGVTRGTTAGHIARAAVESMAFQSRDVLVAMEKDSGVKLQSLKVDGGAAANNSMLQFQADILDTEVARPVVAETTALGAAYLAGLAVGFWDGLPAIEDNWALEQSFQPQMDASERQRRCERWEEAVRRSKDWER